MTNDIKTNPFADYGYIEMEGYIGYKKQLQNQGMETDFYVDFGKGFVPGSPEPQPVSHYLTFTANEDNSSIGFYYYGDGEEFVEAVNLEYSLDGGETWVAYVIPTDGSDPEGITLNDGESVMVRGVNETLAYYDEIEGIYQYTACSVEGSVVASGDITSLLNGIGGDYPVPEECFSGMFTDCTGLTTAPSLPSTTLADSCYNEMFLGCTGLTAAPELPATILADFCYESMFDGCTSLEYIKAMFTTDPIVIITGDGKPVKTYPYTNNWVKNVSGSGTFVKNAEATWDTTDNNIVPSGWTVEDYQA